jgi:tRNA nucleotidyltransferase (CCA-adding enzyme)
MMREPFRSAIPIIEKIQQHGFEAYFVGGAVRDYLLDRPISDVDIATSALPHELKGIFPKTVDVGIEHGTILILHNGKGYEVTTFRTESDYKDFRRPERVTFVRSLEEDLKRRDFTINAMAMDINGKIIDLFDGQEAMKRKILQTVGSPDERFTEDALRMMRAVRFVSQLGFQLEESTKRALEKHNHLLAHIAVERKLVEFEKLLSGPYRHKAFQLLLLTQLYNYLPMLKGKGEKLHQAISWMNDSLTVNEMWALLLYALQPINERTFFKEWRLPSKQSKEISTIHNFLKQRLQQEWTTQTLYQATKPIAYSVEKLYDAIIGITSSVWYVWEEKFNQMPIHHRSELTISGNDLMDWFKRPGGPWVKDVLEKVELAVLHGVVENDKDKIREWLQSCNHQFENNC